MKCCDFCRDPSRPAHEAQVFLTAKGEGEDGRPTRARQVVTLPMELCEDCRGQVAQRLTSAVQDIQAGPSKAAPATIKTATAAAPTTTTKAG